MSRYNPPVPAIITFNRSPLNVGLFKHHITSSDVHITGLQGVRLTPSQDLDVRKQRVKEYYPRIIIRDIASI